MKIRTFYYRTKHFISRVFNYLPILWKIGDFDYTDLYILQRVQLERLKHTIMIDPFKPVDWQLEVKRIDLALRLLDIIIDGADITHLKYPDKPLFKIVNHKMEPTDNKYVLDRYVNERNSYRFIKFKIKGALYLEELYEHKAWYLYHKLVAYYGQNWWT